MWTRKNPLKMPIEYAMLMKMKMKRKVNIIVGDLIARKRRDLGYSQTAMANMLGISQPSLCLRESGESGMTVEALLLMSFKLEVCPSSLVPGLGELQVIFGKKKGKNK